MVFAVPLAGACAQPDWCAVKGVKLQPRKSLSLSLPRQHPLLLLPCMLQVVGPLLISGPPKALPPALAAIMDGAGSPGVVYAR